jgi:hypothetical protein
MTSLTLYSSVHSSPAQQCISSQDPAPVHLPLGDTTRRFQLRDDSEDERSVSAGSSWDVPTAACMGSRGAGVLCGGGSSGGDGVLGPSMPPEWPRDMTQRCTIPQE